MSTRTILQRIRRDKEIRKIPRTMQETIPIQGLYEEGIFRIGADLYSRTYRFSDINYRVASPEDQEAIFIKYCELINALDSSAITKITISNRKMDLDDFENNILFSHQLDGLDPYRDEYNWMLRQQTSIANDLIQEKYLTVSIHKRSLEDARLYFKRVDTDLGGYFTRVGSSLQELDCPERLKIFHDFYRPGEESRFFFDLKDLMKKGHDFKDYLVPDSMEFKKDYFLFGNHYGRVLYLREYASFISDTLIADLMAKNRNMMLSIDIVPVPLEDAIKDAENRLLGIETNVTKWQQRQNSNYNFSAAVPYDMEQQRKELREFLDDLTTRDQRMAFALVTLVLTADSKEDLERDTESVLSSLKGCQMSILNFQQMDGLNTVLPYGALKIDPFRTLNTQATAILMPFNVQDIHHPHGIYYGQNEISGNMILVDRRELKNGNEFILGVSGSGKSLFGKNEFTKHILMGEADVIIIDPEREYSPLVRALGGEVINISANSKNHINALDMGKEYGLDEDPIVMKSEFLMSLCDQLLGDTRAKQNYRSVIDRCCKEIYKVYIKNGRKGEAPTLQDFRNKLLEQKEPEAQDLALAMELFTEGSLNTFAKPTNVDVENRLICYDIHELGNQLMSMGMLVMLESIFNRITENRAKGRQTYIYIDEIYLLFQHEYSAVFLSNLWKRVRKYGAYACGITQNVEDLLQSYTARTMLANSECVVMLSQAQTDLVELADLLRIPQEQLSRVSNAEPGRGLIKVGRDLVPFDSRIPTNTRLYQLMSTKATEKIPNSV